MFRALRTMKTKATKGSKKPNGRAADEANEDWEALCQDIDEPTMKQLLQILTTLENILARRIRKRLEEPEVDDDPIDPDDEPESSEDEKDEQSQNQEQIRTLLAEERLCTFGSRLVQGVQVGTLDAKGKAVKVRLERNKTKLTPTWKEVVGHLDVSKVSKGKGTKKTNTVKESAKPAKSKEIVIEDDSDEEDQEEQEDQDDIHDEDAEMVDVDEQVNGAAEENGDHEPSPERESVMGD
jgi:cohesin complex subunit SA-1/2